MQQCTASKGDRPTSVHGHAAGGPQRPALAVQGCTECTFGQNTGREGRIRAAPARHPAAGLGGAPKHGRRRVVRARFRASDLAPGHDLRQTRLRSPAGRPEVDSSRLMSAFVHRARIRSRHAAIPSTGRKKPGPSIFHGVGSDSRCVARNFLHDVQWGRDRPIRAAGTASPSPNRLGRGTEQHGQPALEG